MAAQPEGREEKYAPDPPRELFSATQACRKDTTYLTSRITPVNTLNVIVNYKKTNNDPIKFAI